jgi:hypothetical protein
MINKAGARYGQMQPSHSLSKETQMVTAAGPSDNAGEVQLEATIHSGRSADPAALSGLDVLPRLNGAFHALMSPGQVVEIVAAGYEVRVFAAHPVGPLDPSLIMDDATAQAWIDDRVAQIRGGRKS